MVNAFKNTLKYLTDAKCGTCFYYTLYIIYYTFNYFYWTSQIEIPNQRQHILAKQSQHDDYHHNDKILSLKAKCWGKNNKNCIITKPLTRNSANTSCTTELQNNTDWHQKLKFLSINSAEHNKCWKAQVYSLSTVQKTQKHSKICKCR